jgi:type I restriction enzyme S subunit
LIRDTGQSKWQQLRLRDICEKVNYGYTASAKKEAVGFKFLRITDIVPDLIDWNLVPYCEISPKDLPKYELKKGDIVIARTGATTGYAKRIRKTVESVFASYLVRVRISSEHDSDFVGHVIESDEFKRFIRANLSGAAQPQANAQVLTSFPIALPPLPTQRKIASVLSAYDELIENNTRRIEILEEMAQRIYREWFVHFRFPGYDKVEMVDSELGLIPEGWNVTKLGDVIELAYGKALKKDSRKQGSIPVYGSGGIVGYHDKSLVSSPGIIVGRKGNVGSVYWSDYDFFPIDTVYYVQTELNLHYVYYNLQDQNFINNDAAVPGLNRNQAYSLPLLLPDVDILGQFQYIVDPIFRQLKVLKEKNENLRRTCDLLLPKLVSGEIDVEEVDNEMEVPG